MVEKNRSTKETNISICLEVYGNGKSKVSSGIGFFDHMLEALVKHSLMNMEITCKGDLHVDGHHTVEDIGIIIGQAIKESIYPIKEVERYGNSVVVMDEAAVECALDLSNRPFLFYKGVKSGMIGEFDCELVEEFFRALSFNAGITLHINVLRGQNKHHIVEATFKAFAVAFRRALMKNEKMQIPSTKGIL